MRVKQRMVLWGALVVLVAGAVGLVVANGGGGGDSAAPALPLSVGSSDEAGGAGDARASVMAADLLPLATYVPGDGLPDGGGREPAYRLPTSVDEGAVREIAAALGIDAAPTEQDGAWHATAGDMALDVYGPGGSWSAYRNVAEPAPAGAGAEGGTTATTVAPDTPVSDDSAVAPGTAAGSASGGGCIERDGVTECTAQTQAEQPCPDDPRALCPEPRPFAPPQPPERPADLPSEDEARDIALDLLGAAGTDVEGADVQVTDATIQWTVTVEPRVGGLPAPGLAAYVAVGAGGRVDSASGDVGPPEELGDYDLIDTRAALERLNDGSWGYRTMGTAAVDSAVAQTETNDATASAGAAGPVNPLPPESSAGGGSSGSPGSPGAAGGGSTGGGGAGGSDPSEGATAAPAEEPPGSAPTTGTTPPTAIDGGPSIAPGEPTPGGPPLAPEPAPEPVEVPVTDAEVVLVSVPSWDDTGTYLVPGYRFTADDGSDPMVPAVSDDVLEPPPGEGEDPGGPGPGGDDPVPLPQPVDPAPPVTPETTVAPGPDPAGTEVEIVLWHCGIEPVELDGQRWVAQPPPFDETTAPPELARRGTLAVAPGGGSATYTDASGVTVEMVPVGEDWQPPPCD
jgi:hypothetical protein